jgi:hypothetical protein
MEAFTAISREEMKIWRNENIIYFDFVSIFFKIQGFVPPLIPKIKTARMMKI